MTRTEFHALRDLEGKTIFEDINWRSDGKNWVFDDILVTTDQGVEVVVNGTFKPSIPTVTYNFRVQGEGPICRVCVNGVWHGTVGRTHKHEMRTPSCQLPHNNLPFALQRPDYEFLSARDTWNKLLAEAKIVHAGTFNDPV